MKAMSLVASRSIFAIGSCYARNREELGAGRDGDNWWRRVALYSWRHAYRRVTIR